MFRLCTLLALVMPAAGFGAGSCAGCGDSNRKITVNPKSTQSIGCPTVSATHMVEWNVNFHSTASFVGDDYTFYVRLYSSNGGTCNAATFQSKPVREYEGIAYSSDTGTSHAFHHHTENLGISGPVCVNVEFECRNTFTTCNIVVDDLLIGCAGYDYGNDDDRATSYDDGYNYVYSAYEDDDNPGGQPCDSRGLGQAGVCIDVNTRTCGASILTGYCSGPGNIKCCTAEKQQCFNGIRGTCIDTDNQYCPVATLFNKCPGMSNFRCCPESGRRLAAAKVSVPELEAEAPRGGGGGPMARGQVVELNIVNHADDGAVAPAQIDPANFERVE